MDEQAQPHLWPLILAALALMTVALVVFGNRGPTAIVPGPSSSSSPTPREARVYTVSYRFGVFSPTNLRIHAGDTVRFRNDSSSAIRIIADLQAGQTIPEFDSAGPIQPGSYFSYTFSRIGTFGYHNDANHDEAGIIIVREP